MYLFYFYAIKMHIALSVWKSITSYYSQRTEADDVRRLMLKEAIAQSNTDITNLKFYAFSIHRTFQMRISKQIYGIKFRL